LIKLIHCCILFIEGNFRKKGELSLAYPVIHTCPICNHSLHVKKLECSHCQTVIENDFTLSRFATLSKEQIHFVEVFLLSRGNIKVVEKELGISYPTVRGKLNEIIKLLGHNQGEAEGMDDKSHIITMLENDEISPKEAIELLKQK